jgi:hypothetical protein
MGEWGNRRRGLEIKIIIMRYKNNALDKLVQLDISTNKIKFELNRGIDQEVINESLDNLREQIEKLREIISIESDDFEQQFGRSL